MILIDTHTHVYEPQFDDDVEQVILAAQEAGLIHLVMPNIDVESISVTELLNLIEQYPSLLRRPIILDGKRMQIGFNEDEIRAFLPRDYRKQELRQATIRAEIEGNND